MTVANTVGHLVQRDAHNHAAAKAHVGSVAPRGHDRFEGKTAGYENAGNDEIGQENHGGNSTAKQAIHQAYALAQEGRKSASLAVSRLESLLFRHPTISGELATSALEYLSGLDLTGTAPKAQATGQAVMARLNHALDGMGARVTKTVLDPGQIARLRVFRQQVRELISSESRRANVPAQ